ncbi:MAG: HAMP domain-containing protein [Gammaproteobacteria bacterium]|nr:HAMP domain-containing protein [Gammaproteobacteria bacterium]
MPTKARSQLFRKYVVYFAMLVTTTLLASGLSGMYLSYKENVAALVELQHEKAIGTAYKIEQYMKEIEHEIGWTTMPQAFPEITVLDQRRVDYLKLLRQVPAITEIGYLDASGKEKLRVSRLAMDILGSDKDFSNDPEFTEAKTGKTWFGPVYFRKETEPYMILAMGASRDDTGVTVADVNLKFIWDVITQIKIGKAGYAYVVDAHGRLISHPDISRVLQQSDFSQFSQVRAALTNARSSSATVQRAMIADNADNEPVLVATAPITALGWAVLVEQPRTEAFAPLYASMLQTGLLLLAGLVLSLLASLALARRMVTPIQALRAGAAQIGAGILDHRIDVRTGDELETLAEQFNHMAKDLQESYSSLEHKVEERTQQLEIASRHKSAFLANMSHELRTPLNAIIGYSEILAEDAAAQSNIEAVSDLQKIRRAGRHLLALIDDVLDLSKIEAGKMQLAGTDFELRTLVDDTLLVVQPLLVRGNNRLETRLAIDGVVMHSDAVRVRQVLFNLLSNACKFTHRGVITVAALRDTTTQPERVVFSVRDTGEGITTENLEQLFQPFVQAKTIGRMHDGTGLGLALCRRFCELMGGEITVVSEYGKGSEFTFWLPVNARHLEGTSAS